MKRSLFRKNLTMTMAAIVISYTVFSLITVLFFTNYWRNEKKNLLTTNASSIANFAASFTSFDPASGEYYLDGKSLQGFVAILAQNIDADIFITTNDGTRLLGVYSCSGISGEELPPVDEKFVDAASAGLAEFSSSFSGLYSKPYFTIGVPFSVKTESGEIALAGAVFASTSSSSIEVYRSATFYMLTLSMLATLALTFIIVWFFTYRTVRPLRQMSAAAKAIGDGDFSVRVRAGTEDEIGMLGLAINNMANSLSNSEGMRRSFIANISHELKTPMTTISGFIDGILDGTIPPERHSYYLKIVSDEVKRLSRLVRSMLDLSKIDSGEMKLTPVPFDLSGTVFSTLLTFEQSIEEKNIDIRGLDDTAPMNVVGDQDLIHQVVYNLIENAVKFTNPDGYIYIGMTDSIDRFTVTIENSGLGIPADELPLVFDRFYKTDKSRSRDKVGVGLGLYLVKTILKLHGGDISVASTENEFCRFQFYLPKTAEQRALSETQKLKIRKEDLMEEIQDVE